MLIMSTALYLYSRYSFHIIAKYFLSSYSVPRADSKHQEETEETDEAPGALELVCSGGEGGYTPRAGNKQRGGDAWGWGAEGRPLWE